MRTTRTKAAAVVALGGIILLAFLYGTAQLTLLPSYVDLERRQITEHVERVRDALLAEIDELDHHLGDRAAWDETYDYVAKPSADYVERNIPEGTFADLRLSAMVILNKRGTVLYAQRFDLAAAKPAPLSSAFRALLQPSSALVRHTAVTSSIKGLVLLPEGPMLVASRPVLTGDRNGPIRGTMIWARGHSDCGNPARRHGAGICRSWPTCTGTRPSTCPWSSLAPSMSGDWPASGISWHGSPRPVWSLESSWSPLYDRLVVSRHERRATEERYRAPVDQAVPLAIAAVDMEGHVQAWNAAAERLFGWSAGEVLRKPPLVLSEDSRKVYEAFRTDYDNWQSQQVWRRWNGVLCTSLTCGRTPARSPARRIWQEKSSKPTTRSR